MASLTQWTWVWVNSRSWWWTGRPGVLQSMGSQRVRHDWATELNWTELPEVQESPGGSLGQKHPLEREMASTLVFLPGQSHGWRNTVGSLHEITRVGLIVKLNHHQAFLVKYVSPTHSCPFCCWEKYQWPEICRWYPSNGRKWRGTKESLDEGERGEWKSWLKIQFLTNLRSWHLVSSLHGKQKEKNGKLWQILFS